MLCLLLTPNDRPLIVELKDGGYEELRDLLNLDGSPMDCVTREIKGKKYDFWIDDEGLLKEHKYITAMLDSKDAQEVICGNILIALHDDEGNTTGLSIEDINRILHSFNIFNIDFLKKSRYESKDLLNYLVLRDYNGFGDVYMNVNGQLLLYKI